MARTGRPPGDTYTEETGLRICERLAEVGSLRRVCKESGMPSESAVRNWIVNHPDFAEEYARAKAAGIDALVEEALDIADDGTNDFRQVTIGDGQVVDKLDTDHVSRSKLRVGYRQWLAERMASKKYGVRQDITSNGESIKPSEVAPVFNVSLSTTNQTKPLLLTGDKLDGT